MSDPHLDSVWHALCLQAQQHAHSMGLMGTAESAALMQKVTNQFCSLPAPTTDEKLKLRFEQQLHVSGICALLFTDEKKIQAFYTHKNKAVGLQNVELFTFKSQTDLVELLRNWQPHFEEQGCMYIAFDVVPGEPIMYGTWTETTAELDRHLSN